MGRVLFYICWPLVWFYAPLRLRSRICLIVDDEILLVRNWFGDGSWQLPGGGVHFGERAELAAARELLEETKIVLDPTLLVLLRKEPYVHTRSGLLFREWIVYYRMKTKPKVQVSREITDYTWCSVYSENVPKIIRDVLRDNNTLTS